MRITSCTTRGRTRVPVTKGGACTNRIRVRQDALEAAILRPLRDEMLAPEREAAKVLTIVPNAAELYRRQIALGLDGAHPQVLLKARMALRDPLGKIRLAPDEDGGLRAAYEVQPAVLVRAAVTGHAACAAAS